MRAPEIAADAADVMEAADAASAAPGLGRWRERYRALPVARKLRLFPRLTGGALALVLLVNVLFGVLAERRLARIGSEYYPSVEATWLLEQTLAATQRTLQDAVAASDVETLDRADSLARVFVEALARDGADARHAGLRRRFEDYYALGRDVSARMIAGEVGEEMVVSLRRFTERHRALSAALDDDAARDREAVVRAFGAQRLLQRVAWVVCIVVTLACVVVLAGLSRFATESLTAPLGEAVRAADRVAEGDLSVRLPTAGRDEVGHLLRSMARMVANLRESEARLQYQATHDALTGLANRVLFRERVSRALVPDGGIAGGIAALYVDLDDFKDINDGLGHDAGDRLLVSVAGRLLNATRGCDTVARLGGDEFAILLRGVHGEEDAVTVAERIARALRAPVALHGREVTVGVSIGIAIGTGRESAEDLLRHADVAMYAAKHGGKARHVVFEEAMHAATLDRFAFEADLRRAVERDELFLEYQPVLRLQTGEIVGVEALVRWRHPERGVVAPGTFIPLAEETGLIVPLGRWVLREACRQGRHWQVRHGRHGAGEGAPRLRIAVNLSGRQLQEPGLIDDVRDALLATGLDPTMLVLEITESVMMHDTEAMIEKLHALKALGVRLAIDDFGTGYSSLSYLHRFPVDILKIDKSFVDGVATRPDDLTLAQAIVTLAETLRLDTVAEGIERADQVDGLRELGCIFGQGYHFAMPLGADAIDDLLARSAPAAARPLAGAA